MESAPANIVDEWSEYDNNGDLQKTKDEAERVNLVRYSAFRIMVLRFCPPKSESISGLNQ